MSVLEPQLQFSFLGYTIYTHGAFFSLAALVATGVLVFLVRPLGIRPVVAIERALWIFLAGLLGARIGFLLTYIDRFESPAQILQIWQGGLISFFGIAAGLLAAWAFVRKEDAEHRRRWFDAVVLATLVGWSIGRWGNYFAAESVGVVSAQWNFFYQRVPIQLIESLVSLLLAIGLYWKRKQLKPGQIAYYGLLGYLIARFFIDFWRDETMLFGLRMSQWVAALAILVLVYRKHRKKSL